MLENVGKRKRDGRKSFNSVTPYLREKEGGGKRFGRVNQRGATLAKREKGKGDEISNLRMAPQSPRGVPLEAFQKRAKGACEIMGLSSKRVGIQEGKKEEEPDVNSLCVNRRGKNMWILPGNMWREFGCSNRKW